MRNRKRLAALATVAVLVLAAWLSTRRPVVTFESYGRLRRGMTSTEITAVLGAPGDHSTGPTAPVEVVATLSWPPDPVLKIVEWQGDEVSVQVGVDAWGRLTGCQCWRNYRFEQPAFENARWRLRRLWRQMFA